MHRSRYNPPHHSFFFSKSLVLSSASLVAVRLVKAELHRSTEEVEGGRGLSFFCKYRLFHGCLDRSRGTERAADWKLVGQRDQDIHVVDGEEARLAVDHALVPVLVDLIGQSDDVALLEAQLALVLWLEVVECSTAGLVHRC